MKDNIMDISTKSINYNLYKRGLYGNKLRTWYSLNEYIKSGYNNTVTLRYSGVGGGMYCAYNIINPKLKIEEFVKQGANRDLFIINESAPDENLLIQGEITKDYRGYNLFFSLEKGKMRDCLKNGIQTNGLKSKIILQKYLFPNSYNDIMELIELYPNHIIEFSSYEFKLGDCQNRNTIIWEIRNY